MNTASVEHIAKMVVFNRSKASDTSLHPFIRGHYKEFARLGEQMVIDEANKVLRWR